MGEAHLRTCLKDFHVVFLALLLSQFLQVMPRRENRSFTFGGKDKTGDRMLQIIYKTCNPLDPRGLQDDSHIREWMHESDRLLCLG